MFMERNDQIHKNHRNRMKNIFLETGFAGFSDVQKLEFLLFFAIPQKDVNPIAHALLDEFGSVAKVLGADFSDLIKVPGVGAHTALLIKTCRAFVAECNAKDVVLEKIGGTTAAKEYCYSKMRHLEVEEFMVVCLSDDNSIICSKSISTGTTNKVNVMISDIMKMAFAKKASKIVFAHNHPSGSTVFSDEDLRMTHNIIVSCLLNDIDPVDHVLVTRTDAISLAESGRFAMLKTYAVNKLNIIPKLSSPKNPYTIDKPGK
jgi:DNA repair protein RadC